MGPMTLGVTFRFVTVIAALAVAARPTGTTSTANATNTAAVIRTMFPFLFAASYHLATYIASLCIDLYLKSTGPFSPQRHILRHRCTKTVLRLVLLDANALLMPFQFQVHLDAELRRVVGDVE